jgi:P-type Cu+ transporter
MQCLSKMSQIVHVEPPTLQDPMLRLTYSPSPPTFTIRDIVSAIISSNSPPFLVTVYKTTSLEDRARSLQAREKRQLLYRLGFSVIVALPTFIIGVVFMSLVSPKHPARIYLTEPMWMGNSSRMQWSLFFLATPVMFYSAENFHRRCMKEIYALWRRGSRTPVWKRFLRFGSMNLLVRVSPPSPPPSADSSISEMAGIIWSLGSLFLFYRLAGPRILEFTIPRRPGRYINLL